MFCARRFKCEPQVVHGHFCQLKVLNSSPDIEHLLTDGIWLCPKAFKAYFAKKMEEAKTNMYSREGGPSLVVVGEKPTKESQQPGQRAPRRVNPRLCM